MKIMKKEIVLIGLIFLGIFCLGGIFAQDFDHVLCNSERWQDVYSTLHYANLESVDGDFLVSTKHGTIILDGLRKEKRVRAVSSRDVPYIFNYEDIIRSKGFAGADELIVDNANLELIDELENIENFVVVGDGFGYNAIAVAPYAVNNKAWVFLANEDNIIDIDNILRNRKVSEVIVYGYVDRAVRESLKHNPIIIDKGDRFSDNIEIVERYLKIVETKQAILTNGEFIEAEVLKGHSPVLFTGKENVPDQIRDYLKNSELEIGVLIGNDIIGAATNIRRSTGISVMVKFARGSRSQVSGIAAVEGLDLFPVPVPTINLEVYSVKYNKATGNLEVTYKSNSNAPAYLKGTITVIQGGDRKRVGDIDPVFISPGNFKTVVYSLDLVGDEDLKVEIFTLYGETPNSLEKILQVSMNAEVVEVLDSCKIEIKEVKYNKQKKSFFIKVFNPSDSDCWVDIELNNVIVNGVKRVLGTDVATKILSDKTKWISINEELDDKDLEDNGFVEVIAYYGERENSLVNVLKGRFELRVESFSGMTYIIGGLGAVIVVLIIWFIIAKRKDDEEED